MHRLLALPTSMVLMPTTWPPGTGGESETQFWVKQKTIALLLCQAKEVAWAYAFQTVCLGFGEVLQQWFKDRVADKDQSVFEACRPLIWSQGGLLMSFCDSQVIHL